MLNVDGQFFWSSPWKVDECLHRCFLTCALSLHRLIFDGAIHFLCDVVLWSIVMPTSFAFPFGSALFYFAIETVHGLQHPFLFCVLPLRQIFVVTFDQICPLI